jgi:hypothetical protein
MARVSTSVSIGGAHFKMLKKLDKKELKAFLEVMADDLVAQARANVVKSGDHGGNAWPPLSKPYSKRKRKGQTPGRGKFKQAMLRDTDSMFKGLRGKVTLKGDVVALELTSVGQRAGRPSNADLLVMHAEGAGNLPERNPAEDMTVFERRFATEIKRFLEAKEQGNQAAS